MDKLFIIIQARMTSNRLPGKVMLSLCGKTVLEVMIDRLKSFKENIIIATTNDGTQTPIVNLCKKLGIKYYEGDTNNVLSRYYEAAVKFEAKENDIIVRMTSDCPLIDEMVSRKTIDYFIEEDADYVGSGPHSGYPRGIDTAVFRFKLLEQMYFNATEEYEKEHVTPYMMKMNIKILSFENKQDDSKYRLTLDEEDDYKVIKEVYEKFDNRLDFSYDELITVLKENKYIYEMNKHVHQKNS